MYEDKTPESIKAEILNDLGHADTREGSYSNDLVSPTALELWKLYDSLNALLAIAFVNENSGEWLEKEAAKYGIIRAPGVKAQVIMILTGTNGTVIPQGTVFLTEDNLEFITRESVTIVDDEISVVAEAAEVGEKYNVDGNTITEQITSISGLSAVTNMAATGGINPQSDAALFTRLDNYRKKPATSGNIYHYEQWALEVDGIGGVKLDPLWDGPGTVKVLVVGQNKEPVGSEIVDNCHDHIEAFRPIGATVTVISAQGLAIDIAASVEIENMTSLQEVQEAFEQKLRAYLQSIAFSKYEIIYNRIAYMLLEVDGVIDYTMLTVNSGTTNIIIDADEVPVLGSVVMT